MNDSGYPTGTHTSQLLVSQFEMLLIDLEKTILYLSVTPHKRVLKQLPYFLVFFAEVLFEI